MEREWSKLPAAPEGAVERELIGEQVWSAMEVLRGKAYRRRRFVRLYKKPLAFFLDSE